MICNGILGALALLSWVLMLWQWWVARRFPLHQRVERVTFRPGLTLLKPLKGCDEATADCLRSWLAQDYAGEIEILFGVASAEDPVCPLVRQLLATCPDRAARLVVCDTLTGANLKVAKLAVLERLAGHDLIVVSDADVRVPADFLTNVVAPLSAPSVGLVNCFYRLANPVNLAMRWETLATNADFWSQVLQSRSLKPLDFALGAVMVVRRPCFAALRDVLADDYQLGHRIAQQGHEIGLCPIVVECRSGPMGWRAVWTHQLRWARTIRVCQPAPYFFSLLSNPTLWPWLWVAARPGLPALMFAMVCLLTRMLMAAEVQRRLAADPAMPGASSALAPAWLAPVKDVLQTAVWFLAFVGNRIEWRGQRMRLRPDGTLEHV